ncbi:MAG: caspase family protein [Bacteroidetes bacterium]|nr:caspase family protein [Fibrella sp.]
MKKMWFSLLSFGWCCWVPFVARFEAAPLPASWVVKRQPVSVEANSAVLVDTLPRTKGTTLGTQTLPARRGKPNLFLISVGANYERRSDMKLAFAQADAQAIFQRFKTQEGHLFGQVKGHVLVCEQETYRVMLDEAINAIQKEGITADDILILFFSGHGAATQVNGVDDFGLMTGDNNLGPLKVERNRLYTYQHDIINKIKDLPCKRIILLDACHSGAAKGNKGLINSAEQAQAIIRQTPPGIITLSSCQANELSWEDSSWKQGAFTRAILDGLAGAANQPNGQGQKDKFITIRELTEYVEKTVPKLVDAMQRKRNPGLMSYPTQQPQVQNWPEADYPLFDFRDLTKETPPAENPCKGPGIPAPPVRQRVSIVGVIPGAAEIDWLITTQSLATLKTKFAAYDVESGATVASPIIRSGAIGGILDGYAPPNRVLSTELSSGYLCVISRSTAIKRQLQRNGRDYYGVKVPITVTLISGKTSQIAHQEVFTEEGFDSDSTQAEKESVKLAFDKVLKSDFALPN